MNPVVMSAGAIAGRMAVAVLCGAAVGLEREFAHKAAGFRTNMLISLGAAVFTLLSFELVPLSVVDRSRIASGIVTGIGFLGGGAILRRGDHVEGVTTAATIWVVAGIGMAAGAGAHATAFIATAFALFVLRAMMLVERWVDSRVAAENGRKAEDNASQAQSRKPRA